MWTEHAQKFPGVIWEKQTRTWRRKNRERKLACLDIRTREKHHFVVGLFWVFLTDVFDKFIT